MSPINIFAGIFLFFSWVKEPDNERWRQWECIRTVLHPTSCSLHSFPPSPPPPTLFPPPSLLPPPHLFSLPTPSVLSSASLIYLVFGHFALLFKIFSRHFTVYDDLYNTVQYLCLCTEYEYKEKSYRKNCVLYMGKRSYLDYANFIRMTTFFFIGVTCGWQPLFIHSLHTTGSQAAAKWHIAAGSQLHANSKAREHCRASMKM